MSDFSHERRSGSAVGGDAGGGEGQGEGLQIEQARSAQGTWPRVHQGLRSVVTDVRSVPVDGAGGDGATSQDGWSYGVEREIPRDDLTSVPSPVAVPTDGQPAPTSYRPSTALESSLRRLNDCLRGEIAAVEAYDLALHSARDPDLHAPLRELRDSHKRRVKMIAQKIRHWNGEPAERSGAWGAFARAVQRAADLFGDRAAMAALAQGEEHGIARYEEDLVDVDPATRDFLEVQLLPLQRESLAFCRDLGRRRKAA